MPDLFVYGPQGEMVKLRDAVLRQVGEDDYAIGEALRERAGVANRRALVFVSISQGRADRLTDAIATRGASIIVDPVFPANWRFPVSP